MQPQLYPTEKARIANVTSLLTGKALSWAKNVWEAGGLLTDTLKAFFGHFKEVFGQSINLLSVQDQLLWLKQGKNRL